jgi:predicted DsbA family dithiol-disulfide isomerase
LTVPIVEVYGSMECPYAYLMNFRLRQLMSEYEGKLQIAWRALSLEDVNNSASNMLGLIWEGGLLKMAEPNLPIKEWAQDESIPPTTFLPAFEALACAQAQGYERSHALSWALRHALYAESRNISMRHEIFAIAEETTKKAPLDVAQFKKDWDSGKFRNVILAESAKGWHEIKVEGSATLVLPDGSQYSNPSIGEFDFDEKKGEVKDYHPPKENWMTTYRKILNSALK